MRHLCLLLYAHIDTSKMDSYNTKPKQQSRPVLLILGTLAVVSVFYFFLRPAPLPVVTKVGHIYLELRAVLTYGIIDEGRDGTQRRL